MRYCSKECYASSQHDSCAQNFYRDCVMEDLQDQKAGSDSAKRMIEILKRQAESDTSADDEEYDDDIASRFEGIDLTINDDEEESEAVTQELISRLTATEMREFEHLIATGRIADLIPPATLSDPWWINFNPCLVQEVKDTATSNPRRDLINRLPDFTQITRTQASPFLKYNLLNLFMSYCYLWRYFNGKYRNLADEYLTELQAISPVASQGKVAFDDTASALTACQTFLVQSRNVPTATISQLINDVKCISGNKHMALELLADLWLLIEHALAIGTKRKKDLKLLQKKIEYFIAWVKSYSNELSSLSSEIDHLKNKVEKQSLSSPVPGHNPLLFVSK